MNRSLRGLLSVAVLLAVAGCSGYENPAPKAKTQAQTASNSNPKPAATTAPAAVTEAKEAAEPSRPANASLPASQEKMPSAEDVEKAAKNVALARRTVSEEGAPAPSTLVLTPSPLKLGSVATNKYATGTVTLTNTGPDAITISQCKTSCGCTSTNCPKGEQIQPGGSTDVQIRLSAGATARTITKEVTFMVEGQAPIKLPVTVDVVAYVVADPPTIDPEAQTDGHIVLKATDEQPFRITSMAPPLIEDFSTEKKVEQDVYLPWDLWRDMGEQRRLTFNLDHPEAESVTVLVRGRLTTPNSAHTDRPVSRLQQTREDMRSSGMIDAPLTDPNPEEKLAIAVKYGDTKHITEALKSGDLDQEQRDNLLCLSARYGQADIASLLLESGASADAKDKLGRTPLMSAIRSPNKAELVSLLLARGADVNVRDVRESTALQEASGRFGSAQVVGALITAGADVNAADKNGQTPLMWAARWGDAARVNALLKAGAKAGARDGQGLSALDYAKTRRPGDQTTEIIAVIEKAQDSGSAGG